MDISIVTTMYYSASFIEEFYRRAKSAAEKITEDYEIIFVNDGSPDNSLEAAVALHQKDPRVRVIDLSRNFGHHKAIMTGLAHAGGDRVFLLDVDLEEQPEDLAKLDEEMKRTGADVVYGVQKKRKGGIVEKITGKIFYSMFRLLARVDLPENLITMRLMTRRYVQALVAHRDQEVFLAGLWIITGFYQAPLTVEKMSTSRTVYTFRRKMAIVLNSVTSFSNRPLVFVFYLGLSILLLCGLWCIYLFVMWIIYREFLAGWLSVFLSVWIVGGLLLFSIGIIGIYLSKIFMETKDRPYTVIRRLYSRGQGEDQNGAC